MYGVHIDGWNEFIYMLTQSILDKFGVLWVDVQAQACDHIAKRYNGCISTTVDRARVALEISCSLLASTPVLGAQVQREECDRLFAREPWERR